VWYSALADFVVVIHAAFVLFVIFGGLLVMRRGQLAWVHIPAALWGVLIEFAGWTCPLTPLEKAFRSRGGQAGYSGGFIDHYLTAVLYPGGLTRGTQVVLGMLALVLNLGIYTLVLRQRREKAGVV
jgi:hypothetical protein